MGDAAGLSCYNFVSQLLACLLCHASTLCATVCSCQATASFTRAASTTRSLCLIQLGSRSRQQVGPTSCSSLPTYWRLPSWKLPQRCCVCVRVCYNERFILIPCSNNMFQHALSFDTLGDWPVVVRVQVPSSDSSGDPYETGNSGTGAAVAKTLQVCVGRIGTWCVVQA